MRFRLMCAVVATAGLVAACGGAQGDTTANGSQGNGTQGNGSQGNGSPESPTKGFLCDTEGATAEGGELVCTLMEGDGNLVWAGKDGSIDDGTNGSGPGGTQSLAEVLDGGRSCTDSGVTGYSTSFVDTSKVAYVYPLGGMTTSHITPIDHIYVYYPAGEQPAGSVLITAPADGVVVSIGDFQKTNGYPYPDHRIVIAHSCDLFSVFIHVGALSPALAAAFASGHLPEPVKVAAGDVLADDSANPNFDFSTFDSNTQLELANPESYALAEGWKQYTANPFQYLPDPVRAEFERLSLRTSAPFDGRIDWDQAGTAQGNWFVKDTNGYRGVGTQAASYDNHDKVAHGYWDTHLSMAPDAVDNTAFIYSIGDWQGCPCQFMSKDNAVDPSKVTVSDAPTVVELVEFMQVNADGTPGDPSQPQKGYHLVAAGPVAGLLAFQLNADGSLTVEKLPGVTSAADFTGFSDKAIVYER